MPSALVIGASRGIGLGLTSELIGRGWQVIATHRSPAPALAATGARLAQVDIDDLDSVEALAASLGGESLDHVLINAGIIGNRADTASTVSRDQMAQLMWTNAIAPVRAARLLLPMVKDGGSVGFMTSILGTVGGRDGVDRTIDILRGQIERTMRLLGVTHLDELQPEHVTQLIRLAPRPG